MAGRDPDLRVHEDPGVEPDDVVALLDHRPPPGALDVVLELDAERPVVPDGVDAAVDLATTGRRSRAASRARRSCRGRRRRARRRSGRRRSGCRSREDSAGTAGRGRDGRGMGGAPMLAEPPEGSATSSGRWPSPRRPGTAGRGRSGCASRSRRPRCGRRAPCSGVGGPPDARDLVAEVDEPLDVVADAGDPEVGRRASRGAPPIVRTSPNGDVRPSRQIDAYATGPAARCVQPAMTVVSARTGDDLRDPALLDDGAHHRARCRANLAPRTGRRTRRTGTPIRTTARRPRCGRSEARA